VVNNFTLEEYRDNGSLDKVSVAVGGLSDIDREHLRAKSDFNAVHLIASRGDQGRSGRDHCRRFESALSISRFCSRVETLAYPVFSPIISRCVMEHAIRRLCNSARIRGSRQLISLPFLRPVQRVHKRSFAQRSNARSILTPDKQRLGG